MTRFELAAPENEHFALFVQDMESREEGSGSQLKTSWGQQAWREGDVASSGDPAPSSPPDVFGCSRQALTLTRKVRKSSFHFSLTREGG